MSAQDPFVEGIDNEFFDEVWFCDPERPELPLERVDPKLTTPVVTNGPATIIRPAVRPGAINPIAAEQLVKNAYVVCLAKIPGDLNLVTDADRKTIKYAAMVLQDPGIGRIHFFDLEFSHIALAYAILNPVIGFVWPAKEKEELMARQTYRSNIAGGMKPLTLDPQFWSAVAPMTVANVEYVTEPMTSSQREALLKFAEETSRAMARSRN